VTTGSVNSYPIAIASAPGTGAAARTASHPPAIPPRLLSPRKVINGHGCFWHLHTCPHARRAPVNNADYWRRKREGNAFRDADNLAALRGLGWQVLTIWECETKKTDKIAARIAAFLEA